jgi:formamidopyrimidine-DNA glycosylase
MPELPEVETIVRGLRPYLLGQCVHSVEVRWPGAVATPSSERFATDIVGREIVEVSRRGKFIIFGLHPGKYLLVHLRMTGCLLYNEQPCAAGPQSTENEEHVRVVLHLASGAVLRFRDMRKFGRLYLVDDPQEVVHGMGPEPLSPDLTAEALAALLRRKRGRIKPLLQDQRFLAGLGNIYVDESLWLAGIHPLRHAQSLADQDVERLHQAIREILSRAIDNKGTTLRDYRNAQDEPGENQESLAVYQRQGQACPRCGQTIERIVVGGRGTHFCSVCQQLAPPGEVLSQTSCALED